MPTKKQEVNTTIMIREIKRETIRVALLGITPFIMNRFNDKAQGDTFAPPPSPNAAERASRLRHDPYQEYRQSMHLNENGQYPTAIVYPAGAIKRGMGTAALDLPGTSKAQIGRLVYIENSYFPIFGVPMILIAMVRLGDISRTPDMRTRAILPHWAAVVEITYAVPILNQTAIINLVHNAGSLAGFGDGRPEKGKLNFGQFRVVQSNDPEFIAICSTGGLPEQLQAIEKPEPYDATTVKMLQRFEEELVRRGKK